MLATADAASPAQSPRANPSPPPLAKTAARSQETYPLSPAFAHDAYPLARGHTQRYVQQPVCPQRIPSNPWMRPSSISAAARRLTRRTLNRPSRSSYLPVGLPSMSAYYCLRATAHVARLARIVSSVSGSSCDPKGKRPIHQSANFIASSWLANPSRLIVSHRFV